MNIERIEIVAFVMSFLLTLILTPFAIKVSYKKGLLDYPKEGSVHTRPVPVMGGVVMVFVFFALNIILRATQNLIPLFLGALALLASGVYDDMKGLSASRKLAIQFISALILIPFGVIITNIRIPLIPLVELGIFSMPLTVIWFLFVINLINIIDGLDGLAAGLSAIVIFTILNFIPGSYTGTQLFVFLGSLMAFLIFNFYPARIFLGNGGSAFVGFMVAYFPLVTLQKSTIAPLLIVSCAVLLAQILDVLYAIFRRTRSGTSIFKGDKNHLHHLALNVIKNYRMTVLLFYLLSTLLAVITLRFISLFFMRSG